MATFRADRQFSYDETLLKQGKYKEWFWQGMDESNLGFLNAPVKEPTPKAPPIYKNQEFPQRRDWRDEAACKDADPLIFFPESQYPQTEYLESDAEWRNYCPAYPVREECLELARKSGSVGIFGGKYFKFVSGYDGQIELDDETAHRTGRPKKYPNADAARLAKRERNRRYLERKKLNST